MIKQIGGLLIGTSTNNNAPAGYVGEYQSSTVSVASAVSLTSTVNANITSLSLTPGDWDVSGMVSYHSASGTTVPLYVQQGISTTSATFDGPGSVSLDYLQVAIPTDPTYLAPWTRVSIAATTSVYLVCNSNFSTSTLTGYGFICARRAR